MGEEGILFIKDVLFYGNKVLLLTGWLGYIGSHGVIAFEKAGYKTVIVDNLYSYA